MHRHAEKHQSMKTVCSCFLECRDIMCCLHSSKISEDCRDVPAQENLVLRGVSDVSSQVPDNAIVKL